VLINERVVEVGRGIALAYEEFAPADTDAADAVPMVLIAGLAQQLLSWPAELCEDLAGRGYRVVRFDNRDVGRSTHASFPPPRPAQLLRRRFDPEQYDLGDLAADTVGLLDALTIDSAHLVGISMGGMIAQTVAARYPDQVRSLISMMSMTGARRTGRPAWSTWRLLAAPAPRDRAGAVARSVRIFRHIGSHGHPFDEALITELAGSSWDRDPTAAGAARQLAAIVASGDRTRELARITAPTLVIHGDRDRMVNPTGGAATARAIPDARLETIPGLGHDLPRALWPELARLIDDHARAAEPGGPEGARRRDS
jgi:pimeloyl-ACP methyl ester carboxylesterase